MRISNMSLICTLIASKGVHVSGFTSRLVPKFAARVSELDHFDYLILLLCQLINPFQHE